MKIELTEQQKEVLLILSEECSEVIQVVSKTFRFGIDTDYNNTTNRDHLHEELGDLLCMISLCISTGLVLEQDVAFASNKKFEKLEKWSNIMNKSA